MERVRAIGLVLACGAALLLTGAQRPRALAQTSGGLWEVAGRPGKSAPERHCVADAAALLSLEHRGQSCTQVVVNDGPSTAVVHYTCARGGFGQSKMTLITPRSLRIETQGISATLPFNYVIQARRVGNCPAH